MASASAVGDGVGEALAGSAASSIRIVPCAGRDEAWGVHRIRGGEFPVTRGQLARLLPRRLPDGTWECIYCLIDGSAHRVNRAHGNFSDFELERTATAANAPKAR